MPKIIVRPTPEPLYHGITAEYVLDPQGVEIWHSPNDLDVEICEGLRQLLSPEEAKRAAEFRFEQHGKQYVIGRGLLRMLLASYLAADPREVRFQYSARGKPELVLPDKQVGVQFNLAHSGKMILLGFTLDHHIGVDVEQIREDVGIDDISQRFFSRVERQCLESLPLPQRYRAFFRCWTRKEALLKGTAEGLSVSLDSFDVFSDPSEHSCCLETADKRKWLVQDIELGTEYAAAVAVEYSNVEG